MLASIKPWVYGTVYQLRGYQVTLTAVTMAQSDTAYQTQRYTFRVVILTRLVRSRYDQYRWIVREEAYITPDPSTRVFGTVYQLRDYQVTLTAVTMAQSDTAYQTQRYTFRVVILTRLVRSRYDQYRWIVREEAYITPDPSTRVFGTVYQLRDYQVTLTAVTMAQSDTAYQTQRYTFRVVILTRLVRSRYDQYRWIVREASFHKAMGFWYRL
jgi:hypothetical protein